MRNRIISLFLSAAFLLTFFHGEPAFAAASPEPVAVTDIGIKPGVYDKLISDDRNVQRPAAASVDGGSANSVKINIRGESSRWIGQAIPTRRIPFRIKYSAGNALTEQLGNKSVIYRNAFTPFRLLAEAVAMDLFEYMDVPTPAHAFSFVQFNGVDFGLYLTIEEVNETFLAKHFSGNLFSLYKSVSDQIPAKRYDSVWFGTLEAEIDRGSADLLRLTDALDKGNDYERYLDTDEFLRALACIAAIGGGGSFALENKDFILYDNNGKFVLIPWDMDEAFRDYPTENSIDRFYLNDDPNCPNPLFDLILSNPAYKTQYYAYLNQILDGFLAPEILFPKVEALVRDISPYLMRDTSIFLNSDSVASDLLYETRLEKCPLMYTLQNYYTSLKEQLNGTAQHFFVNPQYDLNEFELTVGGVAGYYAAHSPMLNTDLPELIRSAYPAWKKNAYGEGFPGLDRESLFALGVFAAGAFVLALSFIIPACRGRRPLQPKTKKRP